MDEFSTTSDTLGQTDEDILTPTVSDDALEAAAGMGMNDYTDPVTCFACDPTVHVGCGTIGRCD